MEAKWPLIRKAKHSVQPWQWHPFKIWTITSTAGLTVEPQVKHEQSTVMCYCPDNKHDSKWWFLWGMPYT